MNLPERGWSGVILARTAPFGQSKTQTVPSSISNAGTSRESRRLRERSAGPARGGRRDGERVGGCAESERLRRRAGVRARMSVGRWCRCSSC